MIAKDGNIICNRRYSPYYYGDKEFERSWKQWLKRYCDYFEINERNLRPYTKKVFRYVCRHLQYGQFTYSDKLIRYLNPRILLKDWRNRLFFELLKQLLPRDAKKRPPFETDYRNMSHACQSNRSLRIKIKISSEFYRAIGLVRLNPKIERLRRMRMETLRTRAEYEAWEALERSQE